MCQKAAELEKRGCGVGPCSLDGQNDLAQRALAECTTSMKIGTENEAAEERFGPHCAAKRPPCSHFPARPGPRSGQSTAVRKPSARSPGESRGNDLRGSCAGRSPGPKLNSKNRSVSEGPGHPPTAAPAGTTVVGRKPETPRPNRSTGNVRTVRRIEEWEPSGLVR